MVLGIYCYIDKKDDSIVYIGKDSNIDKRQRNKDHLASYNYNKQVINRVLQKDTTRYDYYILEWNVTSQADLNDLEMSYIAEFNPKFNFTNGGDGTSGYKHTDESKQKIREINIGKKHSTETKQKVSINNARYWLGKTRSFKTRKKISNNLKHNYPTIQKNGHDVKTKKQTYGIYYRKKLLKSSIDKKKLEKYLEEHIEEILIDQINDDLMEGLL